MTALRGSWHRLRRSLVAVGALWAVAGLGGGTVLPLALAPAGVDAQEPARIGQTEYAERREALQGAAGERVILVLGAREPAFDYLPFRQAAPFRYLTGVTEPDAALLLAQGVHGTTTFIFVRPRDAAEETWSGRRLGAEGVAELTGAVGRTIDELPTVLDSLVRAGGPENGTLTRLGIVADRDPTREILGADDQFLQALSARHPGLTFRDLVPELRELRARKSDAELGLVRTAVDITASAHRQAMQLVHPGMNEFQIEALVEHVFRVHGADGPAYESIVASGDNATILHYNTNDRYMQDGDLLLMDVGASYRGYAADVTRTIPVNGSFSPPQRAIYALVLDALLAAEAMARPGAPRAPLSAAAAGVLARGLADLGLIESPDATFDCRVQGRMARCSQLSLYYMHSLGHGIGLDVHDPDLPTLSRGSAFTLEPGVYVRPNLLEIIPETPGNRDMIAAIRPGFERHRGIGVRVEDNYLVTAEGVVRVSADVPREIDDIEALMRERITRPLEPDPELLDRFRRTGPIGRE